MRGESIAVVDGHTGGEPLRLILGPLPEPEGETMLAKRAFARAHLDRYRTALMWEPRGHADMYGALLTRPVTEDGDYGILFLHNEGFSTMCGHGIIAVTTMLLELGFVKSFGTETVVRFDTPAGRVTATARHDGDRVVAVTFENVPSFVLDDRVIVLVDGEPVEVSVVYGGAFYAVADAGHLALVPENARVLIERGMAIKRAVMEQVPISHPFADDLGFLYGTILVSRAHEAGRHSRNVCVFADGEVDRSPTGTGVSARAALHYARGDIGPNEEIVIESILGSTFVVSVVREEAFGPYQAVVPQVTGRAFLTGRSEFWIDPNDPLGYGFLIR